jgi:hypothetical protein
MTQKTGNVGGKIQRAIYLFYYLLIMSMTSNRIQELNRYLKKTVKIKMFNISQRHNLHETYMNTIAHLLI